MPQFPVINDKEFDLLKKIVINTAEGGGGDSLPDQSGHAGEFLSTDGTNPEWVDIPGGGDLLASNNLSDVDNAGSSRANLGLVNIGISGGIPFFETATSQGTSDLLDDGALMVGGGAGDPPRTVDTGANVVAALGVDIGSAGAVQLNNGSGAGLTALNASNLSSGIIPDARMPDLTGDVTTVQGAVATTIANGAVSLAKMADLAQDQFIGRTTASTGVPETATITTAARTVLDDSTVAAMVDTLGGASSSGTGGLVRTNSPTLVTPALGTPSALVLTNATGLPPAGQTTAGKTYSIGFTAYGSQAVTGKVKGFVRTPVASTIVGWSFIVDAGTATVEVWRIASGTAHPTDANSINTAGVSISANTAVISSDVSDFGANTVSAANDMWAFEITAISGVAELTFQLDLTKN